MRTCPKCSAIIKHNRASRCPECGYLLPRERKTVGNHEIRNSREAAAPVKAAKKPKSGRRSKEKEPRQPKAARKSDRIRITPDMERSNGDDSYDGYYDDVLPADDGEYRQGLDRKTAMNIVYLLIGVAVVVGICIAMLYFL